MFCIVIYIKYNIIALCFPFSTSTSTPSPTRPVPVQWHRSLLLQSPPRSIPPPAQRCAVRLALCACACASLCVCMRVLVCVCVCASGCVRDCTRAR